jgi:hypothetical protein
VRGYIVIEGIYHAAAEPASRLVPCRTHPHHRPAYEKTHPRKHAGDFSGEPSEIIARFSAAYDTSFPFGYIENLS